MPLTSLSANANIPLYDRRPYRRRSWSAADEPASSAAAQASALILDETDFPAAPDLSPTPESYGSRFKADLTVLADLAPAEATPDESSDLLDTFSSLLDSVRSGDVGRAQQAAVALQPETFLGDAVVDYDALGRFLDDLQRMVLAARRGDAGAARSAAYSLARDLRSALGPAAETTAAPAPAPAASDGAAAAYETLMEFGRARVSTG